MKNCEIPIGYLASAYVWGCPPLRANWNFDVAPHMAIFGNTGSGKTWAVKGILANLCAKTPNFELYLLDFKGLDFNFAKGSTHYFAVEQCDNGFTQFFERFKARQNSTDASSMPLFLCFDEYASWLSLKEKKAADEIKNKLAIMLMLGRGFNVHIIIVQQRVDAEYFAKARDNFGAILALGTLSKEAKQMFFTDFADKMESCRRGNGYFIENGTNFEKIIMRRIDNMEKINSYILEGLEKGQAR